jgi:hypothetical protein
VSEFNNIKRFLIMVEAHVPLDADKGLLSGDGMQRLMGSLGDRLDDGDIDSYYTLCCEDRAFDDVEQREDVNFLARMGAALMRTKVRNDKAKQQHEELMRLRSQLQEIKALLAGGGA